MKQFILALALLLSAFSYAQKSKPFEIKGLLIAKSDQTPIESATVYIERVKDSALVTYTITNSKGAFTLEGKTTDTNLRFIVSYVGAQSYTKIVNLENGVVNLNTIIIDDESSLLDEVIIKSRSPIRVKKDTLEFNVASFKTKKDANVEDFLKQLPGVEIDEAGKIKINGVDVDKILINGKPFFGDDPTITTRNISKEMIEKVQIVATKSKSEEFTGEVAESENKTINLTISKEKNKGVFGRISAGGGTDNRYEMAGMLNIFDNDQRISVLAGGNNTNSTGFSFGEIQKMFGGGGFQRFNSNNGNQSFSINGRSFGGGQGITSSQTGGINYADDIGKKIEISADYFYSSSHSDDKNATQRENILPDGRYFSDANSKSIEDTDNHSINLEFEIELDSMFKIDIEPSFSSSKVRRRLEDDEESRDDFQTLTNQSESTSFIENSANNFRNEIDITKRYGKNGGFLRLSLDNEFNKVSSEDYLDSQTEIFGTNPETILRDQFTDGAEELNKLDTRIQYRIPLKGKTFYIDLNYYYQNEKREDLKSTYDFNNATQQYDTFNTELSTDFRNTNTRSTPGFRLNYRTKKLYMNFGSSYVFRTLENRDALRPELDIKRKFESPEAYARFRYTLNPKTNFGLRYNLRNRPPSLRQLNPFVDVSNPLNTVTGNPNLDPSITHSLSGNFNSFNFQKGTGMYTYFYSSFNKNNVVSNSTIDENLVRTTTYTNVKGGYSFGGGGGYNKSIKLDTVKTLKFDLGLWVNLGNSINFSNGVKYSADRTNLTPNFGITLNWKDVMEIHPTYRVSFTNNKFDLPQFNSQKFATHSIGIRTATFVPKKLEWRNDIRYNYNPQIADGFQKSAWFWNASLAYSVLKDQGTITLKAYDLLNQNTNARRIATQNYIEDRQSTVLQRYFMLSFSWKFNSLGKAGEVRENRFRMH